MSARNPETHEEAARQVARVRAIYAIVAGALLLFGLPVYQSVVLGPAGYLAAVTPATQSGDLAPLLAWIARNATADRVQRILQLVPFLLALPLPGFLYERLWSGPHMQYARAESVESTERAEGNQANAARATQADHVATEERERTLGIVTLWAGRAGFALFALAILLGLITSAASASAYAAATTAAGRNAAVASFQTSYIAQTLLSQVLGGLALALFLVLLTRRMSQPPERPQVPLYFRLYGYLIAAVLALNALAFLLDPRQVQTPFTTGALFGLGLWLLGLGLFIPGIGREAPPEREGEPPPGG